MSHPYTDAQRPRWLYKRGTHHPDPSFDVPFSEHARGPQTVTGWDGRQHPAITPAKIADGRQMALQQGVGSTPFETRP